MKLLYIYTYYFLHQTFKPEPIKKCCRECEMEWRKMLKEQQK